MTLPKKILDERELIRERIPKEDIDFFDSLCMYYEKNEDDMKILFIRYRHYLENLHDPIWAKTIFEPLNRPIKIGYLLNPDVVYYNELDDIICNYLRNEGAEIIQFKNEEIAIKASNKGLELYINDEVIEFDGFLSYGYRSDCHMKAYLNLLKLLEQKEVACLHSHYHEILLNDKMLQMINFAASKVPIPDTHQVYHIESAKSLINKKNFGTTVIKKINDFGGDSVFLAKDKFNIVNAIGKELWKGEHLVLQKMIPDSYGESIRVLCIEAKAFLIMKFKDGSNDFRSNVSYGKNFEVISLMDDPKYELYKSIAENAIYSIGNLLISGVDMIDSKSEGIVVLEINGWPELEDAWFSTKLCTYKLLAEAFMKKIINTLNKT